MNTVILLVNTGSDIELKTDKNGKPWTRFRVAHNRKSITSWFWVVAFGRRAEWAAKLARGERFVLQGRLESSQYVDKDGNDREGVHILLENISFLNGRAPDAEEEGESDS